MIHLFNFITTITIVIILLLSSTIECLNFIIPLPNTLVIAGGSSLVTWSIGSSNITATNLYLANGADPNNLIVFSIFGQNIPSSKTSMWVTIPKNAPNDNTYILLEGNDTPPSRATVVLNIVFGNTNSTVSPIPTGPTPTPSANSTTSSLPSSTSKPSSVTKSLSSSASSSSSETNSSETPSSSNSTGTNTIIGAVIGGIVGIGLIAVAILCCLRHQKRKREKRHTELFDDKGIDFTGYHDDTNHNYNNMTSLSSVPSPQQQYYQQHQHQPSPFMAPAEMYPMDQMSYARSMAQNQPPPAVLTYPMKTIDSTNMRDNGFQSRTQLENMTTISSINDSIVSNNNKPNEIDSQKPHSK